MRDCPLIQYDYTPPNRISVRTEIIATIIIGIVIALTAYAGLSRMQAAYPIETRI